MSLARIREVHRRAPACPLVLWTDPLPQDLVFKSLECGMRGTVLRNSRPEQLVASLRRLAAGELQIGFGAVSETTRRGVSLTLREREIIARLRKGIRNKEIADEMGITEGTVKIYPSSVARRNSSGSEAIRRPKSSGISRLTRMTVPRDYYCS